MQGIAPSPSLEKSCSTFTSYIGSETFTVIRTSTDINVRVANEVASSSWIFDDNTLTLAVEGLHDCSHDLLPDHLAAVIDMIFSHTKEERLMLSKPLPCLEALKKAGVISVAGERNVWVWRAAFWQWSRPWQFGISDPFPLRYTLSGQNRHPIRRPKSTGNIYRRHIPWLDQTLSFRSFDPATDLDIFHAWMNDPRVAKFWQEDGDLEQHKRYIQALAEHPSHASLIGCFDGQPFGYFETYWAKEDRIAPYCEAGDFDRGWHGLVGNPDFLGRAFLSAWMPSIAHHLFLEDCRTQRIVVEPRSDNQLIISSLSKFGYAFLKEFSFPHKRAALGVLLRERFFDEAIWIPKRN